MAQGIDSNLVIDKLREQVSDLSFRLAVAEAALVQAQRKDGADPQQVG